MSCLLCDMWGRMPYQKRHTTPTTVQETEGALVVGYWVASRKARDIVPHMCERHMTVINTLDFQEEQRAAAERPAQQERMDIPPQHQRIADLIGPQPGIAAALIGNEPQPIPSSRFTPVVATSLATQAPQQPESSNRFAPAVAATLPPQTPPPQGNFRLGPGPLVNDNSSGQTGYTVPNAEPPKQGVIPVTGLEMVIPNSGGGQSQQTGNPPDVVEGPALIDAPCLFCKVMVHAGEVHRCPKAAAKGN